MPYRKLADAPAQFKKLDGVSLTLAQANKLASMYDAIKTSPSGTHDPGKAMSMAIAAFRKRYTKRGGTWMLREGVTIEDKLDQLVQEAGARHAGWEGSLAKMMGAMLKSLFGDLGDLKLDTATIKDLAATAKSLATSKEGAEEAISTWIDSVMELKAATMSFNAIRDKIETKLQPSADKAVGPSYPWVVDVYQNHVIIREDGKHYKYPYTLNEDGSVVLGDKTPVMQTWAATTEGSGTDEPVTDDPSAEGSQIAQETHQDGPGVASEDEASMEVTERTDTGSVAFRDADMVVEGVTILKPGTSLNNRHYSQDAIHKGYGVFEGAKMYLNHPPRGQSIRSVNELVSKVARTWVDEEGAIRGDIKIFRRDFYDFAKEAKNDVGISINALCRGVPNYPLDGKKVDYIQEFVKSHSVDWVTDAGAGGGILAQESIGGEELMAILKELTVEELKQERPDLVEMLVQEDKTELTQVKEQLETATKERDEAQAERDELKAKGEQTDSDKRVREFLAKEGQLPAPAQERVAQKFTDTVIPEEEVEAKVTEAVEDERAYIRSLAPDGRVQNMGPSGGDNGHKPTPKVSALDRALGIAEDAGSTQGEEK